MTEKEIKEDEETSIRAHRSTVKLLAKYKVHQRETYESVIKRAIGIATKKKPVNKEDITE